MDIVRHFLGFDEEWRCQRTSGGKLSLNLPAADYSAFYVYNCRLCLSTAAVVGRNFRPETTKRRPQSIRRFRRPLFSAVEARLGDGVDVVPWPGSPFPTDKLRHWPCAVSQWPSLSDPWKVETGGNWRMIMSSLSLPIRKDPICSRTELHCCYTVQYGICPMVSLLRRTKCL